MLRGSLSARLASFLFLPILGVTLFPLWFFTAIEADDFPPITNSQPAGEEPPSPEEAVAMMTVPEGFHVSLFAAEPDVQQPIAFDFDDRGRVWVAENYSYAVGEYDRGHRDRIVILEDTDGDGRHDVRKVFWDEGWMLTGLTYGFGGVWVLNNGTLSVIPDKNGDDIPDGEPVVVLDGWTFEAKHNFVSGLLWGPDGWLYGRHGITDTSYPATPGTPRDRREPLNCGIWRFHPTRKVFEVVCRGTTNPWGLDYDEHGQFFFTNNVNGHLWHVIPGAHYQRMFGVDFNPHLYDLIDQHADHYHWDTTGHWVQSRDGVANSLGGGHSHCGGMIYLGDNWPTEYRGSIFMCNTHGRRVNRDILERHGSGYIARHADDFLVANQPWFRGTDLKYGPDGGVYVADWSDNGECHDHDGVHRTSGRIYKITYGEPVSREAPPNTTLDLATLSDAQLVERLGSRNEWHVRRAQRLLQERASRGEMPASFRESLVRQRVDDNQREDDNQRQLRLRLLWSLYVTGGCDEATLISNLKSEIEDVRVWATRFLAEQESVSQTAVSKLCELASNDESALVRLTLASALQRLPLADRWEIAPKLVAHAEDANDHNLPLMIWYGIEPAVPHDPARAVELAMASKIPLVRQHITRRLASDLDKHRDAVDDLLDLAVKRDDALATDVLRGVAEALRGLRRAEPPPSWTHITDEFSKRQSSELRSLTQELSLVFGDGRVMDSLVAIARDEQADLQARRTAIASLVEARAEGFETTLLELLQDQAVQTEAIAGLAAFNHPNTATEIVKLSRRIRAEEHAQVAATLATRPEWALTLLKAVEDGTFPREIVSAVHARQMISLGNDEVSRLLEQVWGVIDRTDAQKQQLIADWHDRLDAVSLAEADLAHGRELFKKTCAACHKLHGEGGQIGPDITGSNRHNLSYLLENILDPSRTVPRQWTTSVIVLTNGRVLNGVVTRKSERTWTIQTAQDELVVPAEEIDDSRETNQSLMPDGLLNTLSDADVRDLFGYLQSR